MKGKESENKKGPKKKGSKIKTKSKESEMALLKESEKEPLINKDDKVSTRS
jgi:hypothetical protein